MLRVLDLFSGAGGAAWGLHQAFPDAEIVGVDNRPMPRYPFRHIVADAMEYPLDGFDFVWASPPCQAYSTVSARARRGLKRPYPDLVRAVRNKLMQNGAPYVLENVPGAPLARTVLLCGSMFGLEVRRHRYFECSFLALAPGCAHWLERPRFRSLGSRLPRRLSGVVGVHGHLNYAGEQVLRERAMGIDWMSPQELTQAIPPAYSRYLAQFIPLPDSVTV